MSLQRSIRFGLGGVAILALGVGGLLAYAITRDPAARPPAGADGPSVAVTATGCEPASLEVAAGPVTFTIVNRSARVLEWEILDGVMVVDERENIAPGMTQRLATRLEPGDYAITCGLLGNPRGRLRVLPAAGAAARSPPELVAFVGPMAEYKVFVTVEAMDLDDAATRLADALHAQDRPAAAAALAEARAGYGRIRPATRLLFADLDTALDARAEAFAGGAADPGYSGFHRLAEALATDAPPATLLPLAERLQADIATLRARLDTASIPPARMLAGAALLLRAAAGQPPDPVTTAANLDGAEKIAALLRPLTRKADPAAADRLDARLAEARRSLAAAEVQALAEEFSALRQTLGLEG